MANTNLTELFTSIADSIRAKDGTTDVITASDFPSRIETLPTGNDIEYSEIYFNCQNMGSQTGHQYYTFDVSNQTIFKFKYDYYPNNRTEYTAEGRVVAYYGYILKEDPNYGKLTTTSVDSNSTNVSIVAVETKQEGIEKILDVTNFTKLTLDIYGSYNTYSTTNYGYLHLYDIQKQ